MSYSGTPTLYGEKQIAAAYQSGTRLPVVSIAVGDGAGAAVAPTEGMTALVNEVWRGPITSWGIDPADARRIVVRTTIPPTAGPFTVREAGVFDSAGGMIAITALAATEIVAPGTSNQATSIDLIVALPIGSAGAITVSPTLGERFTIERLIRTPFISINSASVATPPASPTVGDLYIVPQGATGAWATATAGTIAEWNGIFWAFIAPPLKMVAGIMDAAEGAVLEFLKWNGTVWEGFLSSSPIGKGLVSKAVAGTYSFTVPAGVYWVFGTCVGAGGGGAGQASSSTRSAGGGAAGGTAAGWFQVTPGQTIAYVVGAGGAGCGDGAVANTGGTSSIGSIMQATGGTGGRNTLSNCAGGTPGIGSGGQLNLYGSNGGDGNGVRSDGQTIQGGAGGASSQGGGGRTAVGGGSTTNGAAPGSGAGGCWGAGGTFNGGTGADGFVSFQY